MQYESSVLKVRVMLFKPLSTIFQFCGGGEFLFCWGKVGNPEITIELPQLTDKIHRIMLYREQLYHIKLYRAHSLSGDRH